MQPTSIPQFQKSSRLHCALMNLDARSVLWFISIGIFACSVLYAVDHHARVKSFHDEISSARLELQRYSNLMAKRVKRDVEIVSRNKSAKAKVKKERLDPISLNSGGVTYIRWGRNDCPEGTLTNTVYTGYAAGSHYSHAGSGSNYICIHENVSYSPGRFVEGNQGGSYIYGVEYRDGNWVHNLLNISDIEDKAFQFSSMPCAMCIAEVRISKMVLPGRDVCPMGWQKEYSGYIMAGGHGDTHASKFICVDEKPQVVPGTNANDKGSFLFMVETQCNSLLCEPFVAGRELRCVVCVI